jgi:hypothetical protein
LPFIICLIFALLIFSGLWLYISLLFGIVPSSPN